jgi:tetratricopeptide (TPR) repeat protein
MLLPHVPIRLTVSIGLLVCALIALEPIVLAGAPRPQQPPAQDPPPPPVVTGTGAGGGGGAGSGGPGGGSSGGGSGGSGGGSGGYDGYADIDWDGPDDLPVTTLAFEPFDAEGTIDLFRTVTRGIASGVGARQITYNDAITDIAIEMERRSSTATITALKDMGNEADGADRLGTLAALSAVGGKLEQALAATLAQHWRTPRNPNVLFNLANLLLQRRMPNHALAMIEQLKKTGGKLGMLFGHNPDAAVDYVQGYANLMIGRLQESVMLLSRSFAADKTLTDASYALAVAQDALGGDPRKALLQGLLRPYYGPLMYCGDHYDVDPLESDEEDTIAPPVDKLFDLSQGTDGVLPTLVHPSSGPRLVAMVEEFAQKQQAIMDEVIQHRKKADQIHESLIARLGQPGPDATDVTDEAITSMLDEANVCLKPLQRMRLERNRALEEMEEAVQAQVKSMQGDYVSLLSVVDEPAKAIHRNMITKALGGRRAAIQQYDRAVRVHFKSWNKYATGLAGRIVDSEWREYANEVIAAQAAAQWSSLYAGVISSYVSGVAPGKELYAPDNGQPVTAAVAATQLWRCSKQDQKTTIESKVISVKASDWGAKAPIPDLGVTLKANCDKLTLEADAKVSASLGKLGSVGIGGFVETSVNRVGDITLFGGPKVSAEAGAGPVAVSSSVKDGVYVTFDDEGIKEIGTRISASGAGAQGSGKLTGKLGETDFVIWSGPPRPPKFDEKTGLTIWRNVR